MACCFVRHAPFALRVWVGWCVDPTWQNSPRAVLIAGAADIDFGHVLGNFKEKTVLGVTVRRERAPFVYTKQVCG